MAQRLTNIASNTATPTDQTTVDGRQSSAALEIQRGVTRVFNAHAIASLTELVLPNGRRADLVGITTKGAIWIVEIKSSVSDYQTDQKWPDYKAYCDHFFFAVAPDFPISLLPAEAGLVVADNYGGEIIRQTDAGRLAAARRKSMTLLFAQTAARRLTDVTEPVLRQRVWELKRDGQS